MNNITRDGRVVSTPSGGGYGIGPVEHTTVVDVDASLATDPADERTVPRAQVTSLFGIPITPTEPIVEVPPLSLQIERIVDEHIDKIRRASAFGTPPTKAALNDFATEILKAVQGTL